MTSKHYLPDAAALEALAESLISDRVDANLMRGSPDCAPKEYPCIAVVFRYDESNSMRWAERCDFEYVYPADFS